MNFKVIAIVCCLFLSSKLISQNVDPFTGSFSYGQNILHIPSNRGSGVDIDVSYRAGIQMNQPASEIGLGWNINAGGAIYRSVSGIPDDTKNFYTSSSTSVQAIAQGALYPDTYTTSVNKGDFYTTKRGLDSSEFKMPDFDNFSISGPSFGGHMKLNYHKFYSYVNATVTANPPDYEYISNTQSMNGSGYFRKPQFHFIGDFADTLASRHYSDAINSSTTYRDPSSLVSGNGYTNSAEPFIGRHLNGSTVTSQNYDISTGRLGTSNFVEYFTNDEINTASALSFSTGVLTNFIDYKSTHTRTNTVFPADGIGYFRITASNGLTYHYSLPVYQLESTEYNIPLKNDYTPETALTYSNFTSNDVDVFPGNSKIIVKNRTANKYAIKWLLTAITGADYVDENNNQRVDDDDKGYWISYDYLLWSSSFTQRFPYYGYDYKYLPDDYSKDFPQYTPIVPTYSNTQYKLSGLYGTAQITKNEVYHLNKVRTSSHTALFIRDLRLDEKGMSPSATIPSTFVPAPDLRLTRIVLFKNEQIDSLLTALYPSGPTASPFSSSEFDFSSVTNSASFYSESWFNANFPFSKPGSSPTYSNNFNYCVLKNVYFDQDYDLCKGYYGNVKVAHTGSCGVISSANTVESNITNSNTPLSGKLSLNRIYTYELNNEKVTPSIIFGYLKDLLAAGPPSNPNYNPRMTDYWGYYKYDATNNAYSRYTTSTSKDRTHSWSLLKITDPLGGITEMEYESNSYLKVLDHESTNGFRGATYLYRIKSLTTGSFPTNYDVIMEEGSSGNWLNEFSPLCNSTTSGLLKRMCVPIIHANCTSPSYKSFVFGNVTTILSTSVSGVSNNVTGTVNPIFTYTNSGNDPRYATCSYLVNGEFTKKLTNASLGFDIANSCNDSYVTYSGNGYLFFEMPIGEEVYGGGIRLKKLKVKNGAGESYVKEYTYEDGVATDEADRFEYPRLKWGGGTSVLHYEYLQPKEYSKLSISPYIGYSKVTIKDLGRINSANGKIEVSFITNPKTESGIFEKDNKITTVTSSVSASPVLLRTINESTSVFANVFGAEKETKVFDKNDNMISRSVNEYTTTEQGAMIENLHFVDPTMGTKYLSYNATVYSHTVNIHREIPVVLKSSTSYNMGAFQKTENILRDELTGETTAIIGSAKNNSTSYSYKTPAYKHYQTVESLDYTSPNLRKVIPLGHDMYTYGNIDSTLTPAIANGSSGSFISSGYKLYSKLARQRVSAGSVYTNSQVTLPYYYPNRSFIFDGGPTSINEYGLLSKSTLTANPLNLSTINNNVFFEPTTPYNWRLVSEVTLLDSYKNLVETRDHNNRFSACKYGCNGYYKNSSVSNCNYASYTFGDFENPPTTTLTAMIDGDMIVSNHTFVSNTSIVPHSGLKCIQVNSAPVTYSTNSEKSSGNTLDIGILPGRIYRTSVWTYSTNIAKAELKVIVTGSVNNTASSTVYTANVSTNSVTTIGAWTLIQRDFELPEAFVTGISGVVSVELRSTDNSSVYFDDFVLHPVESQFTASVYNQRNGRLMTSIDGNGLATNYKYDAAGRMLEVWKEIPSVGYKKVKSYSYNYARGVNN